jgi:hypothetical protein
VHKCRRAFGGRYGVERLLRASTRRAATWTRPTALRASSKAAADLTAERLLCGAITTHPLEVAWFEKTIECSNCDIAMLLNAGVLTELRRLAEEAQARIDELPA